MTDQAMSPLRRRMIPMLERTLASADGASQSPGGAGSAIVVRIRHRAFLSHFDRPALPDGAVSGVEGLAALGVCVVLRRLATVVLPVVAYNPYCPDLCLVIRRGSVLVGLRCSGA